MSNPVEIVIKATDRFTPVFESLGSALQNTSAFGEKAGLAISKMQGAFEGMEGLAVEAQQVLNEFSSQAESQLNALAESRMSHLESQGAFQENFKTELGERLIALEQSFGERHEQLREQRFQRERQNLTNHLAALAALENNQGEQMLAVEQGWMEARLNNFSSFSQSIAALAAGRGSTLARIAKAAAIAEALVNTYLAGSKALASVPFPFNFAAAAAVTIQGLATVEKIRQVHIAHGGIGNVPEDSTFLLQRGERVLSPNQNRDLTRFLTTGETQFEGGKAVIENVTIHVLENATSAEALLAMDRSDLRQVLMERIIPALDELAALGIRPKFVDHNT
ncbi:MAG: hypothetical protein V3S64_07685 [bacterium]